MLSRASRLAGIDEAILVTPPSPLPARKSFVEEIGRDDRALWFRPRDYAASLTGRCRAPKGAPLPRPSAPRTAVPALRAQAGAIEIPDPTFGHPAFFVSHGLSDGVFPDQASRIIVPALQALGDSVSYVEFDGGHEVPDSVADQAAVWLAARFA
jgi:hypothetical protein